MGARRLTNERGIALAVAIFALVVIGALVAGTFFVGRVEHQSGQNTVYAAQAYDVVMAMDAAVREVEGRVDDREAVLAALRKADFDSVRGEFRYGANNYPVQNYYLRVVEKRTDGTITNRLVGTVLEQHQDAYVGDCKM